MLELRDVRARFGSIEALRGVSLSVADGEIVSLIGANGAGKSTVLNVISGIVPATGTVEFKGASISELRASEVVRRGIVQVPEGRQVFSDLTVLENFEMGAYTQAPSQFDRDVSQIFALFPRLLERRSQLAGLLSGGEQQMLAIGRALMANPRLLLLDEPSMGLAPLVIASIFKVLSRLHHPAGRTERQTGAESLGSSLCPGERPDYTYRNRAGTIVEPRGPGALPRQDGRVL